MDHLHKISQRLVIHNASDKHVEENLLVFYVSFHQIEKIGHKQTEIADKHWRDCSKRVSLKGYKNSCINNTIL